MVRNPLASIVITTRNRRDDVLRALSSCYEQSYRPLEMLVYDDASDDGTAEAVRSAFPSARVFEGEMRAGYIKYRNRGFHDAMGEYVFSIDDDAYFSAPGIVTDVCRIMEGQKDVAAVAIPFVEPMSKRSLSVVRSENLPQRGGQVRAVTGCAHALRRKMALSHGGYREFFVHQGEERDLCIRMRDAGYRIVYADCDQIVHTVSPLRDRSRVMFYGTRNTLLFDFLNAPTPEVMARIPVDAISLLMYRFSLSTMPLKCRAIVDATLTAWRHRRERKPVTRSTWKTYRSLPGHGPEIS